MYNNWRLKPKDEDSKILQKTHVKIHEKLIKNTKLNYDIRQIENNTNKPRILWNIIHQIICKKHKKDTQIFFIYDENKIKISEPHRICNFMNKFFSNIGQDLSSKIYQLPYLENKLSSTILK